MEKTFVIPKNIFQTHKSKEYVESIPVLNNAVNGWKNAKGFRHFFYDDNGCDVFMRLYFPHLYELYNKLTFKVMKADLWRYCIIYQYGGIYADVDTQLLCDPNIFIKDDKQMVIVPESNNVHFCQWVFAAAPKSPMLKSIIDMVAHRIRTIPEIKGEHVIHYLTSPGVFTDGIVEYLKSVGHKVPSPEGYMIYHPTNYGRITSAETRQYEANKYKELHVFNCDVFHSQQVRHLNSGSWQGGWMHQRDLLLK